MDIGKDFKEAAGFELGIEGWIDLNKDIRGPGVWANTHRNRKIQTIPGKSKIKVVHFG